MLGMRVYARPFAGVELGLSRHLQWGGEGRPRGTRALADAVLARTNVEDAERGSDPSNELAGIDLRLAGRSEGGWAWVGHAQLIGEDEASKLPSRRIATAGYSSSNRGATAGWNGASKAATPCSVANSAWAADVRRHRPTGMAAMSTATTTTACRSGRALAVAGGCSRSAWPGCRPVPTTASAFAWRCSTVASMNKGRSR